MKTAIAIKSCHKHAERRQAQLDTWLKYADTDFFYLIGNPTPGNGGPVITDALACDVSDAFENIAPKILYACMYALSSNITNLFVCDDDTYAFYSRLMKSGFEKLDYVGHMRTDGIDYNQNIPYAQGSAYWLTARSMEHIVKRSDIMRGGIIDDGAVGQCLIDKVPFTHDCRYHPGPAPIAPDSRNNVITTHKCQPAMMRQVHEHLRHSLYS